MPGGAFIPFQARWGSYSSGSLGISTAVQCKTLLPYLGRTSHSVTLLLEMILPTIQQYQLPGPLCAGYSSSSDRNLALTISQLERITMEWWSAMRGFLIKKTTKKPQLKIAIVSVEGREGISEFMKENGYFPIAKSTMSSAGIVLNCQIIHQLFVWVKLQDQN